MSSEANSQVAGRSVSSGAEGREEDIFRRTDLSRHLAIFNGERYPLKSVAPIALVTENVTIVRGRASEGYPFLEDTPPKITVISMAPKEKPSVEIYDGVATYTHAGRREMVVRIKVLLQAIVESKSDAVVLTAFGWGAKHPIEQVAVIFKEEIPNISSEMPFIVFAVPDEQTEDIFKKALRKDSQSSPNRRIPGIWSIISCRCVARTRITVWNPYGRRYWSIFVSRTNRTQRTTCADSGG